MDIGDERGGSVLLLDSAARDEVARRYDAARHAETRMRYQIVLLAGDGREVPEIAAEVRCSASTVWRVLQRYREGGPDAVPHRPRLGHRNRIPAVWETELRRVIEQSPREVGVESATWTTGLLAAYLARATGHRFHLETVRLHLHKAGYVCKRPTWTPKRKAEEQPGQTGWEGDGRGRRCCWRPRRHPPLRLLRPLRTLCRCRSRCWVSGCQTTCLGSPMLSCTWKTRWASRCTRRSAGFSRVWCAKGRCDQRLVEAPGKNEKRYGFGLVDWRTGWFDWSLEAGRCAAPLCAQVRRALTRSARRNRIALVPCDNLSIYTPRGSHLLRDLLAEVNATEERLVLVYTPAYDPDANRIEWLWHALRRAVTHCHTRRTLDPLLDDASAWATALTPLRGADPHRQPPHPARGATRRPPPCQPRSGRMTSLDAFSVAGRRSRPGIAAPP